MKSALEEAARNNDTTISGLLEGIVADWLHAQPSNVDDSEVQRQMHLLASKYAGSIKGRDPDRAENAKALIRDKLMRKRAS